MNDHPTPWKVKEDNNSVSIVDRNGIKVLTMSEHSVLLSLNKKNLPLAKKIVRLINLDYSC